MAMNSAYTITIDMSKQFDTVNRKLLFTELEKILNENELHLLDILINDVKIKIRVEN